MASAVTTRVPVRAERARRSRRARAATGSAGCYWGAGAGARKEPISVACGGVQECVSGFCVDLVCCDAACSGICAACTSAKKGGGSDGTCGNVAAGTDPDDDCVDEGLLS